MTGLLAAQRKSGRVATAADATHNLGFAANLMAAYLPDADPIMALKGKWSKLANAFIDTLVNDDEFDFIKEDFLQAVAKEANPNYIKSHFRDTSEYFIVNIQKGWKGILIDDMKKIGTDYILDGRYYDDWGNTIHLKNFKLIFDRTSGQKNFKYSIGDFQIPEEEIISKYDLWEG